MTGDVVYANYGRLSDFQRLDAMHVSLKGKIVLVRYGGDFRGVKVYLAQHYGAAGVLIYSDPADGGSVNGATVSGWAVPPGCGCAARVGAVHAGLLGGSDDAGGGVGSGAAGFDAADCEATEVRSAGDSGESAFVGGCGADSAGDVGGGGSARTGRVG